jgi:hypothetical protein
MLFLCCLFAAVLQLQDGLVAAARSRRVSEIQSMARGGADLNRPAGNNGWTPLMHAIHKNQKESVRALLDAGANVNARTSHGLTALMMAAAYGQEDIVQLLLERGADPRSETRDGVNALTAAVGGAFDIDRFTVGHCQTATVRALLTKAPDLRLKPNWRNGAARLAARWGGCTEVLRLVR